MKGPPPHRRKTSKQGAKNKHGRAATVRAKRDRQDPQPGRRKYAGL